MTTISKVLALLNAQERERGIFILLLAMGMALLEVAGVASIMPFLAAIADPGIIKSSNSMRTIFDFMQLFGVRSYDQFLIGLGSLVFALVIIGSAYRTFALGLMNRYIEGLRHGISIRLLAIYLRQPYTYFIERHSGEMSKGILSEVDELAGNVIRPAFAMLAHSTTFLAIIILLLLVNTRVTVFAGLVLLGMYSLVFSVLRKRLHRLGAGMVSANKERFKAAVEVFGAIKTIKFLGVEKTYLDGFRGPSKQYTDIVAIYQTIKQAPKYILEALVFGGLIGMILFLLILDDASDGNRLGRILPVLGLYALAAYRLQPAMQGIFQGFGSLSYGAAIVDSLQRDFDADALTPIQSRALLKPISPKSSISFSKVSYRYSGATKPTLSELNLDICVGESVGIVGLSGSGKTTMVDMFLGLLTPTDGAIMVDGTPIVGETRSAWQKSIGYVSQDIYLLDASIAQNIAFGISPENIDMDKVLECAKMSRLHDFVIGDLSKKYQTRVGERGIRLSGGQRQRIGIARALYRDPCILVLDEATSALDTETEKAVMESIEGLKGSKTIIIVAHRLSTVQNCTKIVTLSRGKIVSIEQKSPGN